jgi:hypothetical protein
MQSVDIYIYIYKENCYPNKILSQLSLGNSL